MTLDARADEQAEVGLAQLSDLLLNHRPHRFRELSLRVGRWLRDHPATAFLSDHARMTQVTDKVGHEQRVAFGLRLNQLEQVIELRFFAGLSVEETARVLEVSADTVARDWRMARTWLLRELDSTSSS